MKKVSKNKSKISKEILTHFNCGHCGKWWSIGDAPKNVRSGYVVDFKIQFGNEFYFEIGDAVFSLP